MTEHRLIVAAKQAAELAKNHPPPGKYDDLCRRLIELEAWMLRHDFDFILPPKSPSMEEAAAAIIALQQQVRDARGKALDEAAQYHTNEARLSRATGEAYCCSKHHDHSATAILALKDKRPADVGSEIAAIFKDLAAKQQPLDTIVARAINENIEGLYEP